MKDKEKGDRRSKAMKAALELVELICSERMAYAVLDPDPGLCEIGAQAGGTDPVTARKVYAAMIDAQR